MSQKTKHKYWVVLFEIWWADDFIDPKNDEVRNRLAARDFFRDNCLYKISNGGGMDISNSSQTIYVMDDEQFMVAKLAGYHDISSHVSYRPISRWRVMCMSLWEKFKRVL